MFKPLVAIVLLTTLACNDEREVATTQLSEEKLVSAEIVPTAFNEHPKTRVVTDKRIYTVWGYIPPVTIGDPVFFHEEVGGDRLFISFKGSRKLYSVGRR